MYALFASYTKSSTFRVNCVQSFNFLTITTEVKKIYNERP